MKRPIKKIISILVGTYVRRLKREPLLYIRRLLGERTLLKDLQEFKRNGIPIDVVYDIGANRADWAKSTKRALGASTFYLFEANEKCEPYLIDSKFKYFIAVLSSDEKTVKFYNNDSSGDSYYKENTVHYSDVKPTEKAAVKLDTLIQRESIPLPDLIKIDTQGSELDIFDGAQSAVDHATMIYVECPIIEYNKGAPNIHDYLHNMSKFGFLPHDIYEIHNISGVLVQIDILFIKKKVFFKVFPEARKIYPTL